MIWIWKKYIRNLWENWKEVSSNNMFNIYYINYAKAYEIAMLIDNKILESKTKEKDSTVAGNINGRSDVNSFEKFLLLVSICQN